MRKLHWLFGVVALAAVTGCPLESGSEPEIIGDWVSEERIAGEENQLDVGDNMRGEARIFFYIGEDAYYADFDVEVDENGGDFDLEMECQGNCSNLDFTMECEVRGGDRLRCEGDNGWENYDFSWERD